MYPFSFPRRGGTASFTIGREYNGMTSGQLCDQLQVTPCLWAPPSLAGHGKNGYALFLPSSFPGQETKLCSGCSPSLGFALSLGSTGKATSSLSLSNRTCLSKRMFYSYVQGTQGTVGGKLKCQAGPSTRWDSGESLGLQKLFFCR